MKTNCFAVLLGALILITPYAKSQEKINATVTQGENSSTLSPDKNYVLLYENPTEGRITFKNNTFAKAKLNIDLLRSEVLFLSPEKILTPLANQDQISYFNIGKDLFFKSSYGIVQVIANIKDVQLGIVRGFKPVNVEKEGAYGMTSSTSSIQQISSILETSPNIYATSLTVKQKVDLGYFEKYYLISNGKYLIANNKNFSKVFKIKKKELDEFTVKESIDFSDKDDLIELMNFCTAR
ncbi:MAG TPA: hypothetical protein DDY04_03525 [Bacteroidales bacterium]|nr:hypothetical protein [Bacteroidales bacterium]